MLPPISPSTETRSIVRAQAAETLPPETFPISLEAALQLANVQNPDIGLARERINEALARQDRASALWLPNLQFGAEWLRHDGQIQRFNGEVHTVSRSSLFVGGGAGISYDLTKVVIGPLAARQLTSAASASAAALTNERLLEVAVVYMDLVQAQAELVIRAEALTNALQLLKITESHLAQGTGTAADSTRARTEASIRQRELFEATGQAKVIAARLVELLNLPPTVTVVPIEPALVPLELIPDDASVDGLVAQGLSSRPELAENQSLAEAARLRWRAAKLQPLLPELRLEYIAGGFGGGKNSYFGDFNGRGNGLASARWQIDNLGLGNRAEQRERYSQYQQTLFRKTRIENEVAREIISAHALSEARKNELTPAQKAIEAARESFAQNLKGVADAPKQYRPIELLQALQALARTRLDYLQVVAAHNRAQFRLYAALGNPPLTALEGARTLPINEPVVPQK